MNHWDDMLAHLNGNPVQPLLGPLGRVIQAADAPLSDDELADVTSAAELALIFGITRQAAHLRLQKRGAT